MKPGDLVSVAPNPDEVGPTEFRFLEPLYCRAVTLISLDEGEALVQSRRTNRQHLVPASYIRALRTRLFPEKTDQSRAVVYLDQCVVSELVKHARGELSGRNAAAAQTLSTALDEAIFSRETAICLQSHDHQLESSGLAAGGKAGGEERFKGINEFLALRSRGLKAKGASEALEFQLHQLAGLRSGGHVFLPESLWKLGLTRDPEQSNARTGIFGGAAIVTIPWAQLESGSPAATLLESVRENGGFADLDTERRATIEALRSAAHRELTHLFVSVDAQERASLRAVLEGSDFGLLPYTDIKSTLLASLLSEPKRKFRDSDLADVEFASCSLPFADLMLVDKNLHNRITRHGLDAKYETSVLSARLDDYYAAAAWLCSRLR